MALTSLNQQGAQPFTVQDPDALLKAYGYNVQAIAEAAKNGIVDPTAAVLAGMKYKYMQTAAQAQGQKPQTVAEEVLTPPAPQGLGALPQGMMAEAAPAMPPPQTPMSAAPMMAGPEAMMAEGGLAGLEVPDDMFMESDNYGGGGMVAFARAGEAKEEPDYESMSPTELIVGGPQFTPLPMEDAFTAFSERVGQPGGKYREQYMADLERRMSPEQAKMDKDQALGEFLMNLGFGAAAQNQPGGFIANLAAAAAPAGTAALKSAKEAKKEQKEALKDAVNAELEDYGIRVKTFEGAMTYKKMVDDLTAKGVDLENAKRQAAARVIMDEKQIKAQLAVGLKPTKDENRVRRLAANFLRENPNMSETEAYALAEREAGILDNPYGPSKIGLQVTQTINEEMATWDKSHPIYEGLKMRVDGGEKLNAQQKKTYDNLKKQRDAYEANLNRKYAPFLGGETSVRPGGGLPPLDPNKMRGLEAYDTDARQ